MSDGNHIAVPAPLLWGALAVLLGGGGSVGWIQTHPDEVAPVNPASQVLTLAAAQLLHNQIIVRIAEVEIGLLCFGKGNAQRAVRYWMGENLLTLLTPDQQQMLTEQEEFLEYYKRELAKRGAKPCIS